MHTRFAACTGTLLTGRPLEERVDATTPVTSCPSAITPTSGKPGAAQVNCHLTLTVVPDDARKYSLGSRSNVKWAMQRCKVDADNVSQIKNDPKDWPRAVEKPRHILDPLARLVRVSVETVRIARALPNLQLTEEG